MAAERQRLRTCLAGWLLLLAVFAAGLAQSRRWLPANATSDGRGALGSLRNTVDPPFDLIIYSGPPTFYQRRSQEPPR